VIETELNKENSTFTVELTSAEEANRFFKSKQIEILGVKCKLLRLGESMYGETLNLASRLEDANVGLNFLSYLLLDRGSGFGCSSPNSGPVHRKWCTQSQGQRSEIKFRK
jgi:hypothetical protein